MKSSLLNISTKLKSEMFSHVLFFKIIVIPSPPFRGDAGEVQPEKRTKERNGRKDPNGQAYGRGKGIAVFGDCST